MRDAGADRLVVLGASLGGLDALGAILRALPADFCGALAVVQHRRADYDSRLAELLARGTAIPVTEPDDRDPLRTGHALLAPAGYHMLIEGRHVALSIDEPVVFARPSIDVLFESAAESYGERAAAVLLTGASEDGAAGIDRVQRAGGFTIVQDPRTAESPIAPQAALRMIKPAAVLKVEEIADVLVRWCEKSDGARAREGR